MSLSVLPRNTGASSVEEAQSKLKFLIGDALTVLALIRGTDADADRAIEVASARADVKPFIRRVVWVPDVSVLTDEQRQDYFSGDTLLCTVGLTDTVAMRLSASKAAGRLFVERAFLAAESQGA
jgi:hypothetical protein